MSKLQNGSKHDSNPGSFVMDMTQLLSFMTDYEYLQIVVRPDCGICLKITTLH